MKPNTKNWILLSALAGATLVSSIHAQSKTTTRTFSSSGPGTMSVYTSNGGSITRVMQGGEEPQTKDDLFAGTEQFSKNATDVTEINMGPDSLGDVSGRHSSEARNTVLKIVRSYEYDKPGLYDMAAVEQFRNKLNTGDWHCSVHTRNMKTGESTDVCAKHRTDGYREEAIITIEAKELTFIHTITKVNAGDPGGHSELFYGPMPGMSGTAMMALMNPDTFTDILLAQHGYIVDQMRGMIDMKIDLARASSQLASIHPLQIDQINMLSRNLAFHINPQPKVHVHVNSAPHPEPLAPLPPLEALPAPPAPPAAEAAPAVPAAPASPAEPAAPASQPE